MSIFEYLQQIVEKIRFLRHIIASLDYFNLGHASNTIQEENSDPIQRTEMCKIAFSVRL